MTHIIIAGLIVSIAILVFSIIVFVVGYFFIWIGKKSFMSEIKDDKEIIDNDLI